MSPVKRQVVNRLVRLACAETSQEVLKELGSKKTKDKKKVGESMGSWKGEFFSF